MHFKAVIELVWRYTCRPGSSEFGDALGNRYGANFEAVID
jgi:hypothetical protein